MVAATGGKLGLERARQRGVDSPFQSFLRPGLPQFSRAAFAANCDLVKCGVNCEKKLVSMWAGGGGRMIEEVKSFEARLRSVLRYCSGIDANQALCWHRVCHVSCCERGKPQQGAHGKG